MAERELVLTEEYLTRSAPPRCDQNTMVAEAIRTYNRVLERSRNRWGMLGDPMRYPMAMRQSGQAK